VDQDREPFCADFVFLQSLEVMRYPCLRATRWSKNAIWKAQAGPLSEERLQVLLFVG
jgi:hypothetical protein